MNLYILIFFLYSSSSRTLPKSKEDQAPLLNLFPFPGYNSTKDFVFLFFPASHACFSAIFLFNIFISLNYFFFYFLLCDSISLRKYVSDNIPSCFCFFFYSKSYLTENQDRPFPTLEKRCIVTSNSQPNKQKQKKRGTT